jgi:hypothetical protein
MKSLEELLKELPLQLQNEVREYAQYLVDTKVKPKRKYLRMDWAGGLKEFRGQYTSLELQKKALEWRGD